MKAILVFAGLMVAQPTFAQSNTGPCDGQPSCVTDLAEVVDAMASGTMPFLANAASTATTRMDEAHDKTVDERGYGIYYGNKISDVSEWPGVIPQDCTSFVLEILAQAYKAAGLEDEWSEIFAEASRNSGSSGFKGLELMQSLQKRNWTGHYWNPDVKNPRDSQDEHPWSYYLATKNEEYYGLALDMDRPVINYNLTDVDEAHSSVGLDALKEVPFALLAARGGKHMGVVVYGVVYDFHWSTRPTSKDVITAVPLEDWGWLSGAIVVPEGTWPSGEPDS